MTFCFIYELIINFLKKLPQIGILSETENILNMIKSSEVNVESESGFINERDGSSKDDDEGGIYTKRFVSSKKWEWSYFRVSQNYMKFYTFQ